jgi:ATP-binding cassette subfamily C protein CydC
VGPALAALGFFVALALAETVHPLRRGIAEIGRMRDAARRVLEAPDVQPRREAGAAPAVSAPALCVTDLAYHRDGAAQPLFSGLSFTVSPGETLAITGPSGRGKSTLLALLAGLEPPSAGSVRLGDVPLSDWPEHALRDTLTLVPQRSALLSGTILENLRLARADVTEEEARAVLRATALDGVIAARGGLDSRLDEGGRGLSGGETRRLVLARALLRRPGVLLLDEPTEGLDDATARRVLSGVRSFLPDAAIVTASHRTAETAAADRVLDLKRHIQKSRFF